MRLATVALTRGYPTLEPYSLLINRNKHVLKTLYTPGTAGIDNIIFHEGNIPPAHQQYIQQQTPDLPLTFINVHATPTNAFRHSNIHLNDPPNVTHPTYESNAFPLGYKHMCHFWFIDFLEACKEYDYIIRVDEDCFIQYSPTLHDLAKSMRQRQVKYVTPFLCPKDNDDVTVGLPELAHKYCQDNNVSMAPWREHKLPYTNCMVVDIKHFLYHSPLYQGYAALVHNSGAIYINRWGDLPLWGVVVTNFLSPGQFEVDSSIRYYHESHKKMVNPML